MTTEREIREAERNAERILRPDFESGKRLKGLDEMPSGQWEYMENPHATVINLSRRRRRNWLRILLVSAIVLAVSAWLFLSTICTFYTPPKYYDWQERYEFGPWQDMSDSEECRMNVVQMIKRWEWDRLSRR